MVTSTEADRDPLQPASSGVGRLLQRDYWAVIEQCRSRPSEVVRFVASQFSQLPPEDVVVFEHPGGDPAVLEVGDELNIKIRLAGDARVRVVHICPCSITLATLEGHPEAGRITFGAYRNRDGDVVFHIRSRARSSSLFTLLGFLAGGDPMQTATWTDFVANVAATCGSGVKGHIRAETHRLSEEDVVPADETMDAPTFVAEAD